MFFENNLNYYDFFNNRKIGRKKIIIIMIFKKQFMIFSLKNMIFSSYDLYIFFQCFVNEGLQ